MKKSMEASLLEAFAQMSYDQAKLSVLSDLPSAHPLRRWLKDLENAEPLEAVLDAETLVALARLRMRRITRTRLLALAELKVERPVHD